MANDWLEINDPTLSADEISQEVQKLLVRHLPDDEHSQPDPCALAQSLWREMVAAATEPPSPDSLPSLPTDSDIVPRNYVIDWQTPILGPIHAAVRRLINAEIRRYLMPALEKQTFLNAQLLQAFRQLAEENARLRRELDELRKFKG
ncbi:MAG: hypothetical protein JW981_09865 [Anaerolineae bacterium]|nr:hypothetical protein [Anaerolineae bacterium]